MMEFITSRNEEISGRKNDMQQKLGCIFKKVMKKFLKCKTNVYLIYYNSLKDQYLLQ